MACAIHHRDRNFKSFVLCDSAGEILVFKECSAGWSFLQNNPDAFRPELSDCLNNECNYCITLNGGNSKRDVDRALGEHWTPAKLKPGIEIPPELMGYGP